MPTIQLTQNAQMVAQKFSRPFQLKNSGDVSVFVGLAPFGVGATLNSTNKDHTITPGGFLGITPGEADGNDIWLCVGTGETGEVEQIYDSSGAYSPGPSDVLARLSAQPELIATYTLDIPAAAGNYFSPGGGLYLGPLDISRFASIRFNLRFAGSGMVGAPGVNNLFALSVAQCKDDSGVINSATKLEGPNWWFQDDATVLPAGLRSFATNVIDRFLILNITASKPVTPNPATLTVEVWGSFTQVATPYEYEGGILNSITTRMQDKQLSLLVPILANQTNLITHTAGTTYFTLTTISDADGITAGIMLGGSTPVNYLVGGRVQPVANGSQTPRMGTFFAPCRRLVAYTNQFAGAGQAYLNLTQQ